MNEKRREKKIHKHTHLQICSQKHSLIYLYSVHRFCVAENKLISEHYRQVGIYSNRNKFFSDEISDSGLFCSISFTYDSPRARLPFNSCDAVCCVCPALCQTKSFIKYMVVSVRVAYINTSKYIHVHKLCIRNAVNKHPRIRAHTHSHSSQTLDKNNNLPMCQSM